MPRKPAKPDESFKSFSYAQFARIGKALSAPGRLVLLNILSQGPHSVDELAVESGGSVANTSHHLQVLKAAGLVESERAGQFVVYRIADDEVVVFFRSLKKVALNHLSELQRAVEDISVSPTRAQAVGRDELVQRARGGDIVVLDVRPSTEFNAGHLPGAISVPLDELETRLSELPRDREIVAYCRGRYCLLADRAVELLSAAGIRARRSDVDVVEWREASLPVQQGIAVNPV